MFLFTDVVGSTGLWEQDPDLMRTCQARQFEIVRDVIREFGGYEFKQVGDGLCVAFASASQAVRAAIGLQRRLCAEPWPESHAICVRVGVYAGSCEFEEGDYIGPLPNRAARLMSLGHGSQILVSESAYQLAISDPGLKAMWKDLGRFELRGIERPHRVYQVWADGLPHEFPENSGQAQGRHNLYEEERTFVGRSTERAGLRRMLLDRRRLVTVTGIGGIGKTTLARQLAFDSLDLFPEGVWFVDCDGLATERDLLSAIAEVVGSEVSEPAVVQVLKETRCLLVLDCFERMVSAARAVDRLVRSCPNLFVVVTSRTILGLPREFEYPLSPLAADGKGVNDSMTLFMDAAAHVAPSLQLNRAQRSVARQICRKLEGVPLAIVLAAGRLRTLSVGELLEQLETALLEPLSRRGTEGDRHRTLRVVIAGSLDLIDSQERELLARLPILQGSFAAEDVRAVLDPPNLLDSLQALREASLLMVIGGEQPTRYKLLDSVREHVTSAESPDMTTSAKDAEAHAHHYRGLAETVGKAYREGEWKRAVKRFWADLPNLRTAVEFWVRAGSDEGLLAMAGSLARIYFETGLWDDFAAMVGPALEAAERLSLPKMQIELLGLKGAFDRRRGAEAPARDAWLRRARISEAEGEWTAVADAYIDLAIQAYEEGNADLANEFLLLADRTAREYGLTDFRVHCHCLRARLRVADGLSDEAYAEVGSALSLIERVVSPNSKMVQYGTITEVLKDLERFREAAVYGRISLRMALDGAKVYTAVRALLDLAECEAQLGDEEGRRLALTAVSRARLDPSSNVGKRARKAVANLEAAPDIPADADWARIAASLIERSSTTRA